MHPSTKLPPLKQWFMSRQAEQLLVYLVLLWFFWLLVPVIMAWLILVSSSNAWLRLGLAVLDLAAWIALLINRDRIASWIIQNLWRQEVNDPENWRD